MKNQLLKTQVAVLLLAGAILIAVGGSILAAPAAFFGANGIELGADPSLLNELKAPAGLLLAAGLLMIGAVFVRRLADTATSLAALIFLGYALARLLSMAVDGAPAAGLVQAAALEGIVGLAALAVIAIRRLPTRQAA